MTINAIKIIPAEEMRSFKETGEFSHSYLLEHFDGVVVISITDHDVPPIFPEASNTVLPLVFDDGDPERETLLRPFTRSHAEAILNFLVKHDDRDDNLLLLVNCMAGISRSGAVGSFARSFLGTDYEIFKSMNPQIQPNSYISMMLNRSALSGPESFKSF